MMNEGKSIVVESIKFGFRTLYEHILLFVMVILTSIGTIGLGGLVCFLLFLQFGWVLSVLHIGLIMPLIFFFILMAGMLLVGLLLGLNKIVLELYDYDKSSVKKLFSCFRLAPKAIMAIILYVLGVLAGLVLFIIPGIFIAIRFSLFYFFIVDQNVGAVESLKMSYEATKKRVWQWIALCVALSIISGVFLKLCISCAVFMEMPTIVVSLLGLAYGVNAVFAIPFSALVYVYFYRTLVPKNSYSE